MNSTVRGLLIAGISAGALVAVVGCGLTGPGQLTAAPLDPAAHASSPRTQQAPAAPSAGQPAAPTQGVSPSGEPGMPAAAPPMAQTTDYQGPHFSSPLAAMSYLAAAYNSGDAAALHAVTTPASYLQLMQMKAEAVNLQLQSCRVDASRGDYLCDFTHDYPASLSRTGHGGSEMVVAPAENPGWYMYSLVECG